MWDDEAERDKTKHAFKKPTVGDLFQEMYSYWVIVIDVNEAKEQVTVEEFSILPRDFLRVPANDRKYQTFKSFLAYEWEFAYKSMPGYWMYFCRNDPELATKLRQIWVSSMHIAESLQQGDESWRS